MIAEFVQDILNRTDSNLPAHTFDSKSFDNWRWQGTPRGDDKNLVPDEHLELWGAIGKFPNAPLPLMLLWGIPGVGKTHLATAMGWNMMVGLGIQVIYYQAENLLDALRERFDKGGYSELISKIKNCGLLIIDDLGAHKETPWSLAKLDAIIDYRYMECKHTIITSNTLELPSRILDRCKEGILVRIRGESQRKRKGKNDTG